MVRVLQIFGEPISFGGQESFVMNMYETIDKNKIQFDFFTPFYCNNENMKNRIEKMGGNIYISGNKFETPRRKLYFIRELNNILKKYKYDIVHINSGSTFVLAYGSKIAKKNHVKKVIVHSHCNGVMNFKHKIIKLLSKNKFKKYTDVYLACSDDAAKWKFSKDIINSKKYIVIKNGIQIDKFVFDKNIRGESRKKLGFNDDNFVIGHVGRMEYEKNHLFILNVFKEILKKDNKAKLLLVGGGSLENNIISRIDELGINDSVKVLKSSNDISVQLQAIDIFIFPSLYEGLGMALIEAQSSGLQVFVSENIPEDAHITDNFIRLNLSDKPEYWADEILKRKKYERKNMKEKIQESGFDAKEASKRLEKIYLN